MSNKELFDYLTKRRYNVFTIREEFYEKKKDKYDTKINFVIRELIVDNDKGTEEQIKKIKENFERGLDTLAIYSFGLRKDELQKYCPAYDIKTLGKMQAYYKKHFWWPAYYSNIKYWIHLGKLNADLLMLSPFIGGSDGQALTPIDVGIPLKFEKKWGK